jgi:Tfp pilus assembly protein PilV
MRILPKSITSESGTSLAEGLVSLAILMTVLVPVLGFMGATTRNRQASDKVIALNLGRYAMEHTLLEQAWNDSTYLAEKGWTMQRSVAHDGALVTVRIRVVKEDRETSELELSTSRINEKYYVQDH